MFEAVRAIVASLQPFEPKIQERILRWAREKARVGRPCSDRPWDKRHEFHAQTPVLLENKQT